MSFNELDEKYGKLPYLELEKEFKKLSPEGFTVDMVNFLEYKFIENKDKTDLRSKVMTAITEMKYQDFIDTLLLDPDYFDFVPSQNGDSDYEEIDFQIGKCSDEIVYSYRHELRYFSREDFMVMHLLSDEERENYYIRKKAMDHINLLSPDELDDKLRRNTLPYFPLAQSGDPDYKFSLRVHKGSSGKECAAGNRNYLRTMSQEHFMLFAGYSDIKNVDEQQLISALKDKNFPFFYIPKDGEVFDFESIKEDTSCFINMWKVYIV